MAAIILAAVVSGNSLKRFIGAAICGLLLPVAVQAVEFQMRDGSLVNGSILRLVDGVDLVVDTAHMGEVTLEWDAINRFSATPIVEIEFFDGRRLRGSIQLDNGILQINGDQQVVTAPENLFTISEVKARYWDRVDVYVDLGANVVRGNSRVTQYNLGTGYAYNAPGVEFSISAITFLNEQEDNEDTSRTAISAQYTRYFLPNTSFIGLYEYEADEQQDLDGRSVLGGALGQRIINNREQRVELFAGFARNSEDAEQSVVQESNEAVLGARYRLRMAVDVDASLLHFQNLDQTDRYRNQFDATLTAELSEDFDLNLTAYNRYDSEPPGDVGSTDYGMVLGLRWGI